MTRSRTEGRGVPAEGTANQAPFGGARPTWRKQETNGVMLILGKWEVTEMLSAREGWGGLSCGMSDLPSQRPCVEGGLGVARLDGALGN